MPSSPPYWKCLIILQSIVTIISGVYSMQTFSRLPEESWARLMLPNYVNWTEQLYNQNISIECRGRLRFVFESMVHERRPWASKMFNSWAQSLPTGIFMGTSTELGDYDQCMTVEIPGDETMIVPQFCLVDMEWPVPKPRPRHHNLHHKIPSINSDIAPINQTVDDHFGDVASLFYYTFFRIGVCVPRECSQVDIERLVVGEDFKQIGFTYSKMLCTIKRSSDQPRWSPNLGQIVGLACLIPLFSLTIIATLYDLMVEKSRQRQRKLLWFSMVENTKKLLLTESSNDEISCIHGIRICTISWIVVGHTIDWAFFNMYRDTFAFKDRLSGLFLQPLFKGHYSVETFFYLSGLLTSYMTIQYTKGHYKNFSSAVFLIFRYLRLMPQLMIFLMIMVLMPPLFDGPMWTPYMERKMERCAQSWWQQIFFIQNFDIEHLCSVHTWYLAADMQLHWLSLIPVIYLLKNPKHGLLMAKFLIVIGMSISAVQVYVGQLAPGGVVTYRSDFLDEEGIVREFFQMTYKSWNHLNVFFIGFLFGYYISNVNLAKVSQTKTTKVFLWLLSIVCYLFCIFYSAPWLYGREYVPIISAILFPMSRTVWAILLTLLIWLCSTNSRSILSQILSWQAIRPLSRMTYAVYLTHSLVMDVALIARRNLIDARVTSLTYLCVSTLFMSYMSAFLFTIIIEAPLISFYGWLKHICVTPSHPASSVGSKHHLNEQNDKKILTKVIIMNNDNNNLDNDDQNETNEMINDEQQNYKLNRIS